MNRILFEKTEIADGLAIFGGVRAEHVLDILHGEVGQILKTGEIDGPVGTSEILAINRANTSPSRFESRASRLASSPSRLESPVSCPSITVRVHHNEESLRPWCDLILAPPRPRVMKRLLPQLAALGVGRLVLVGAEKVEKDFWGATLLKPENYRPLLIDGLMQCGASVLPTIETWKSFRRFLREGLPSFPHARRLVAHPYAAPSRGCISPKRNESPGSRLLLAIGPEGGWTDAEVAALETAGFERHSLGPRILRTDTATVALLARLMPSEPGDMV